MYTFYLNLADQRLFLNDALFVVEEILILNSLCLKNASILREKYYLIKKLTLPNDFFMNDTLSSSQLLLRMRRLRR